MGGGGVAEEMEEGVGMKSACGEQGPEEEEEA